MSFALSIFAGCAVFGGGRPFHVTGTFVAIRADAMPSTSDKGTCSAVTDGSAPTPAAAQSSATARSTSSFIGRSDLPAMEIMCSLGNGADDGYVMITIPNLPAGARLEGRTFSFIQLEHGSWSDRPDPGVAWIVGKLAPLTSGYLSSRSGDLTITHADSVSISGTLSLVALQEWSF